MNAALAAQAADLVARTTKAQGLPVEVDDPSILAAVAAILAENDSGAPRKGAALADTSTTPAATTRKSDVQRTG